MPAYVTCSMLVFYAALLVGMVVFHLLCGNLVFGIPVALFYYIKGLIAESKILPSPPGIPENPTRLYEFDKRRYFDKAEMWLLFVIPVVGPLLWLACCQDSTATIL